ncbi:MAG: hypothetical protein COY82_00025 [Parcubacteria group bacterium CG_4_10_14_0_8_um_filter_35_7]|nr:MAG: hypothetical protein COX43_01555 [Parcubacteria group bacterium CG23_combo_of_CG06-09_8_20_14_all_35_9]PIY78897.1 MAG: hypothetical protein COY82_00025 [Parcubacteria group bacterium CG_4_10_14_0_8_um_filter_35_7]
MTVGELRNTRYLLLLSNGVKPTRFDKSNPYDNKFSTTIILRYFEDFVYFVIQGNNLFFHRPGFFFAFSWASFISSISFISLKVIEIS